jgi:hypothetical protein
MDQDGSSVTKRIKSQAFRILANPNVWIDQGFLLSNANKFGLNIIKRFLRYVIGDFMLNDSW